MSREHQTIRRIYEAFSRRDLDAIARELHDEAQVDFSRSLGPERGGYHGFNGVERLLNLYWEPFEDVSLEVERFVDGPHGIMALVVARGRSALLSVLRTPHPCSSVIARHPRWPDMSLRATSGSSGGCRVSSRSRW